MEEERHLAAVKKAERNAYHVVNILMERIIRVKEEALFEMLNIISIAHYDDIVDERSIQGFCGYILCSEYHDYKSVNQQYLISVKHNKVFDWSERKKYCSNYCYNASVFLSKQLRQTVIFDDTKKAYQFLEKSHQRLPKCEIPLVLAENIEHSSDGVKSSGSTNQKLDEHESCEEEDKSTCKSFLKNNENNGNDANPDKITGSLIKANEYSGQCQIFSNSEDCLEYSKPKVQQVNQKFVSPFGIQYIEHCLKTWVTAETTQYLYSKECNKEPTNSEKIKSHCQNDNVTKMEPICYKLSGVRLKDVHRAQLKLNSLSEKNPETMSSQRQILLQQLQKASLDLLPCLDLDWGFLNPMLSSLVSTFHLTNKTIMFKPADRHMLLIVLLHLLSIRNNNLHSKLKEEPCQLFLKEFFSALELDASYLNCLYDKILI